MTGTAKTTSDVSMQMLAKKLPLQSQMLLDTLNNIQRSGWTDQNKQDLNEVFEALRPLSKISEYPPVEFLVTQLLNLLTPLISKETTSFPAPTLESLHTIARQLKEAIDVTLINPEDLHWEDTTLIRPIIIIGLTDKVLAQEIINQIKYFSYRCIICENIEEIQKLIEQEHETYDQQKKYGAIILDIAFCQKQDPISLKKLSEKIPIIFIASSHEVASRLFAVQAGGKAYLVRPLEFTSLIEKIDKVTMPSSENSPYRILIVEDSNTQANIIKKHLEDTGMITEVLMDPLKISDVLNDFQPDLILLDLYMPLCSGLDLAQVIRQQDLFMSIPIVFLSVEENIIKQQNAIVSGGDDFLTKPLTPQYLTSSVTSRAKRYRALRAGMTQDSLTNLLNHTRILEQLELEIARAKRNKAPLCFAMIDIDYFKNINDAHGHPVGDRVIKGLARLLKQQLRKTDNVGRYGGEEFAVILPQSEIMPVLKKLETIRRAFSKLLHRSADPTIEFSATFSVGLATLSEDIKTVDHLVQAADRALYLAKEKGRNCIVVYTNLS